MDFPTISIITPTWQRHDDLLKQIENIRNQDYTGCIEHVIVSDGPDLNLLYLLQESYPQYIYEDRINPYDNYRIKFAECGRNWSEYLPESFSAIPLMTATALASSDYHMWMADDEKMLTVDHISKLMNLIQERDVDFVYSKVLVTVVKHPGLSYVIGKTVPEFGQITHCLYNTRVLKYAMYQPFVGSAGDWDVIRRWMIAGATWAFLDEMTLYHKADK